MNHLLFAGVLLCFFSVNAASSVDKATLDHNNEQSLFNFVIGSKSTVVARTNSYKSGINAEGELIVAGGANPLSIAFDSDDNQITINDNCANDLDECNSENVDPVETKNKKWKSILGRKGIPSGNHVLALEQNGDDCDLDANKSTNQCSLDLDKKDHINLTANGSTASASPVPLPCAAWLFGSTLLGMFGIKRKPRAAFT